MSLRGACRRRWSLVAPIGVWKQRSAGRREPSADWRQEDPWQQSWQVRAKGGQKNKSNNNHTRFHKKTRVRFQLRNSANVQCGLVLCFRGRHPSEAAAHRQKRGGCLQLDSTSVQEGSLLSTAGWKESFTYILLIQYQK